MRSGKVTVALITWFVLMLAAMMGILYELYAAKWGSTNSRRVAPHSSNMHSHETGRREHAATAALRILPSSKGSSTAYHSISTAMPALSWGFSEPPSAIPFVLWQTYKTWELPKPAQDAAASWTGLNPDLASRIYSDPEASNFMLRTLGAEVLAIYEGFPLGVMRADFWRYSILWAQGGIYADIDTSCARPVK